MVGSQIANLTPNPSFGHNLCFKCPNGSCEPILYIYIQRDFQWYKEFSNQMGFYPWNHYLKIWESIGTPTPKMEAHLGVWGFIPSHFPTFMGAWDVTPRLPFLAHTLASPCLGHEPKVRVVTTNGVFLFFFYFSGRPTWAFYQTYPNCLGLPLFFHCCKTCNPFWNLLKGRTSSFVTS